MFNMRSGSNQRPPCFYFIKLIRFINSLVRFLSETSSLKVNNISNLLFDFKLDNYK